MEILGSIQGEKVLVKNRQRMQRQMRRFIARMQKERNWKTVNVAYKVHFWRPLFGRKIDSLIEFRSEGEETWLARATGFDAWRAFCGAMAGLSKMVGEAEIKEEKRNEGDRGIAH